MNSSDKAKLTLYVNSKIRTRIKTAANHANQSITDFLMPYIEEALKKEENRMRESLNQEKK